MVCIVIGARKFGVNPDNIATPIAASLGDLITLSILALVSSFFYKNRGEEGPWDRPPSKAEGNLGLPVFKRQPGVLAEGISVTKGAEVTWQVQLPRDMEQLQSAYVASQSSLHC